MARTLRLLTETLSTPIGKLVVISDENGHCERPIGLTMTIACVACWHAIMGKTTLR